MLNILYAIEVEANEAGATGSRDFYLFFNRRSDSGAIQLSRVVPQTENFMAVAAHTRSQQPYLELIQRATVYFMEKYWTLSLYFGIWKSDLEGRIEKLTEQGIGIDA